MNSLCIEERIQRKTETLNSLKKEFNKKALKVEKELNEKIALLNEKKYFFSLNIAADLYQNLSKNPNDSKKILKCLSKLEKIIIGEEEEENDFDEKEIYDFIDNNDSGSEISDSELNAFSKSLNHKDELLSSDSDGFDKEDKIDMSKFLQQFDDSKNLSNLLSKI